MSVFTIKPTAPFSFNSTLFSHGWIDLAPFEILSDTKTLATKIRRKDQIDRILLSSETDQEIIVTAEQNLDETCQNELSEMVKRMFRLDEDYTGFYKLAGSIKEYKWIKEKSAGRMFRCATLWEDMVKMLCTTNCTWNLTKIMVNNLVEKTGRGVFPTPDEIAVTSEKYLREKIKMGYRAPYLLEFSRNIADGILNIDTFDAGETDTNGLYKEILKIKGFGKYAVSNLLKLLGRYDYYGSDSWSTKKFSEKHFAGKACTENDIAKQYDHLGEWRGLFFWLDMTQDWYEKEFPW